ncbi:hypothetical protein HAX54_045890 [Datura stramonium]|uniref:Uncharacterized protein n=1 Tax=Datura stramonium TaxID=4076 RepID=A0ABS8SRC1_DATST|nr:hypothetical protein [Datura stramonium]
MLGQQSLLLLTLIEMKLSLYVKAIDDLAERPDETLLLDILAAGGKVRVLHSEGDLSVKMKLHSLKIKDELQDSIEATTPEKELTKGKKSCYDIFYEALGSDDSDFVSLTFTTRHPDSPDYDGIDTQMSISMSKLEFFCNRPTLVALINFGFDLSSGNNIVTSKDLPKDPDESSVIKEKTEELGHTCQRVVWSWKKLESFLLDIKVHPSSTSIEGTLGNFRLCDLTLGSDQRWGWLCDIRNQGAESLIQFVFKSHSTEDDDYEGYDYSLRGRLSAITAYFMELATPHTEEAIKLVDKVGGIEWLIQKYGGRWCLCNKADLH